MPGSLLAATAAFFVVTVVPGLPVALWITRRSPPPAAVTGALAVGSGVVVWFVIGLVAVHQHWFTLPALGVAGAAVTAAGALLARAEWARLRLARPGPAAIVALAVAGVAVALRARPVYFAYQVADFGEYVNRANRLAGGGEFGGWFVNGFPLVLGESSLLLGEARTPDVMPFLGLALIGTLAAILLVAGAGRWTVIAVAAVLAVQVHFVWFSVFPASEGLYALLLALSVLIGALGVRGRDPWSAVPAALVGFAMVVSRGNGLVHLPVVCGALVVAVLLTDRDGLPALRGYLAATAAGLWVGTLYDARFNSAYFLDTQAGQRLPGPVGDAFTGVDRPVTAAAFTVGVVAVVAGCWWMGVGLGRLIGAGAPRDRAAAARAVAAAVLVLGALGLHLLVFDQRTWSPRYEALGAAAWIGLPVAVAVWVRHRAESALDGVQRFLIGFPLVVAVILGTFQVSRLRKSATVDAPWFLYWDRYFFSEVVPMLVVAAGTAVAVLMARSSARSRRVVVAVGLIVAGAALVDTAAPTANAVEHEMFAGTYEELAAVDALLGEPLPVVYDGLDDVPAGWFWPNSSRVLAEPLAETFGHRILNRAGALADDPDPSERDVAALLAGVGADAGYLVQVNGADRWDTPWGREVRGEEIGRVLIRIERLDGLSRVRPEDQAWITSDLFVRVVRVSR